MKHSSKLDNLGFWQGFSNAGWGRVRISTSSDIPSLYYQYFTLPDTYNALTLLRFS
jgi:hypothetical protein